MGGEFRKLIRGGFAFVANREGSVLPLMALLAIPILAGIGAAVDYSRAATARTQLQTALDSAVLAGAKDGSPNWSAVALAVFNGNPNTLGASAGTPSFSMDQNGNYHASVTGSVGTSVMQALGISSIAVSATTSVAPGSGTENSCILTLDHDQSLSDVSLTLNGAPNLSLTGCGIRSNTSMNCNGHNGNASASIAAGNVANCSNSSSNQVAVPDIYAGLNTNITMQCPKGASSGVTWDASATSPPAGLIKISQSYGTEYHVCGDLTLTGTGYLTGATPSSDTIIVVENGNLNVAAKANVNTVRTTIVLTGDNSLPSAITFPTGKGQGATLTVSPSTNSANPWVGIAIYQDPVLTNTDSPWGIADTFGPGATFNADGVVYLPRSNVTWHGSGASNNNKCTKFVLNTFTTDGSVNLNFSQTSGCTTLGVQQWVAVPLHLAQ
ncbi:MAG TPA: pilus assembly protein TadG-related protein [Xanthobacteraceae bacterium]|nr:pilus assembly protein TadG-related protein [Xanthobacteraceae bacterium]